RGGAPAVHDSGRRPDPGAERRPRDRGWVARRAVGPPRLLCAVGRAPDGGGGGAPCGGEVMEARLPSWPGLSRPSVASLMAGTWSAITVGGFSLTGLQVTPPERCLPPKSASRRR